MIKYIVVSNIKGGCGKTTLCRALADVLPHAILSDIDPQQSLTQSANITGRQQPYPFEKEPAKDTKYRIVDTAPYFAETMPFLMRRANLIIIPTLVGLEDLVALKGTMDILKKSKTKDKAIIVFNRVPKSTTKTYERMKSFFKNNYKDLRRAETTLSPLVGYQTLAERPIWGPAKKEIIRLIKELGI